MLDASVALKWVLIEPDTAKSRHIRDEFRNGVHELIAPDSFALEIQKRCAELRVSSWVGFWAGLLSFDLDLL